MKFRDFNLKGDITQLEYVTFRVDIQDRKPDSWEEIQLMPIELFYDVLVRAAAMAGWVDDVVETNEYDEETVWSWVESGDQYIDDLPAAGKSPLMKWGELVFERWTEIRNLDPN